MAGFSPATISLHDKDLRNENQHEVFLLKNMPILFGPRYEKLSCVYGLDGERYFSSANFTSFGLTSRSKSRYFMRISSQWDPALNTMSSSSASFSAAYTSMP